MGIEKRKSRRTDVNVYISLRQLDDKYVSGYASDTVDVNVINISKDGMAFKSLLYEFKETVENKAAIPTIIFIFLKSIFKPPCTKVCDLLLNET